MNKTNGKKLFWMSIPLVAGLLLITLSSAQPGLKSSDESGLKGKAAPEWTLKNLEGKTVSLSDFKGKVVILDFWATWCPPCREEIPGFVRLQKQYGKDGLVVVGVSLDEDVSDVKRFTKRLKVNYPIVMGDEEITEKYWGVQYLPTTFVIDTEGKVVSRHVGFTETKTFEGEIKPLLSKGA